MSELIKLNVQTVIQTLNLEPHPTEGGYFRRTYTNNAEIKINDTAKRSALSSIYYLLSTDSPTGKWHKNKSDIIHYYHGIGKIEYRLIAPDGQTLTVILGQDILNQETLQLTVPGGYWKHATLVEGAFCLLSEAVCPGFDYEDNVIASEQEINSFEQRF